jgi:SHS2 domain-containing protein
MKGFELLEHTADIGLRVWASSREGFFQQAAAGLNAIMTRRLPGVPVSELTFTLTGQDDQALVIRFLNELIFQAMVHHLAATKVKVEKQGRRLQVSGTFGTYHRLKVSSSKGLWSGEIYFDL